MKNYIVELIGTFFLVLVIGLTGNPIAIGAALMVMIYMGGHLSGAHYNPAVTLALMITKNIKMIDVVPYIISQVLGASLGAAAVHFLGGTMLTVGPNGMASIAQVVTAEVLFTFALCAVVLATACSRKMKGNHIYGLAIGATVMVGAYAVGAISGGAFNPAVGTGPALYDFLMSGQISVLADLWVYWVAPVSGGALAAALYKVTG